jgi:hypothetical protein
LVTLGLRDSKLIQVSEYGPRSLNQCYGFKNIFAKTFGEKFVVFCPKIASFFPKIITLVFEKNENVNFSAENWKNSKKM